MMMNKLLKFISFAVAVLVLAACTENDMESVLDSGIKLEFRTCTAKMVVKAGSNASQNNENLINSVYYFFYPKDDTTSEACIQGFAAGLSVSGSYEETIPVSSNVLNNELFKNSRECSLFAIANPPSSIESVLQGTPTLAELRELDILSSLSGLQDNFVMVYDDHININSRSGSNAVSVAVPLTRLACKITVNAYVPLSITNSTYEYTPATTGSGALSLVFGNALNRTTGAGYDPVSVSDGDFFSTDEIELAYQGTKVVVENSTNVTYHHYTATIPVYSYPMTWSYTDKHEPYLLYKVMWTITDLNTSASEYKPLYYKLMLGQTELVSNDWYDITAKLTVIGSLLPDDPSTQWLYQNYLVKDWTDAFAETEDEPNTPAVIKDNKYLMVPQTSWEIFNQETLSIPYSTSHTCEIVNLTATKTVFYDATYTEGGVAKPNKPHDIDISSSISFDLSSGNTIVYSRPLNNTIGAGMDCSAITVHFTIRHVGDNTFSEDITIVQYPAIYLQSHLNSSGEDDTTEHMGYVYVNGNNVKNSRWDRVLGANSGQSGSNTCRYMLVIHVSQFDSSTGFIIGDPRMTTIDNLNPTGWSPTAATAPGKEGGNRTISYYYPTNDDAAHMNFVAPVLRTSSSHSHMSAGCSYTEGKQRCASYQEDGYPAGRWRLPTKAEVQYISILSNEELIPTVFLEKSNTQGAYHYAGGYFQQNGGSPTYIDTTTGSRSVRCVYDEWYWSKVDAANGWDNSTKTFVWGDVARQ